jgi:hypothetical protein
LYHVSRHIPSACHGLPYATERPGRLRLALAHAFFARPKVINFAQTGRAEPVNMSGPKNGDNYRGAACAQFKLFPRSGSFVSRNRSPNE